MRLPCARFPPVADVRAFPRKTQMPRQRERGPVTEIALTIFENGTLKV